MLRKWIICSALTLAVVACQKEIDQQGKWNVRGTWYYNAIDGGMYDSLTHYVEVYVLDDSTLQVQGEDLGTTIRQRYKIKNDTLSKCYGTDFPCMYEPIFRLNRLKDDTLWISMNPKFTKRNPEMYWVRLPAGEKGPSDFAWTEQTADSLNYKILVDYDRRKFKYYLTREGRARQYDSLVKAGKWNWTMKSRM